MSRIFINYRRQDSEGYVGRLYDHLLRHFAPADIFMDVSNIPPGADFVDMLETAVQACDVFIAVIGPNWLNAHDEGGSRRLDQWNDFVRIEIEKAIEQKKRIIPVLVGKTRMPAPDHLPETIRPFARRNAFELSHERFGEDATRLIDLLRASIPVAPVARFTPAPTPATEPAPPSREEQPAQTPHDPIRTQHKHAALQALRTELLNAAGSPLYAHRVAMRYFPVLGEGDVNARLLFIGEAPGKNEAETGKPFCGASGEVLDEFLRGIGLARDRVFMTNILHDKPPEKREPTPDEIAFYTPYVDRLIDIVQPRIIAPLGRFAMHYLLKKLNLPEKGSTITQLHGKLINAQMSYGDIYIIPLYHPAVVLYKSSDRDLLRKDFEKLRLLV